MTPREKVVVRAVAKALRGNPVDMDALAMSYEMPATYSDAAIRIRAAILLEELAGLKNGGN